MQTKKMLRKNRPKALTAVLSTSRSANRAPPGSSSRSGRSHQRRRSECNSHVWSTYPPTFFCFFFLGRQRSGYETRKRIGVLLTTHSEAPRNLKGSEDAHISLHIFFCGLWLRTPRLPPRGRGDSKRSTGHEQIEQSAIQSASRVTLAPQHEKAERLIGEGSEEASESGRPAWSAVHVVQVHIGSNLQRGRFRPCVSGLLAKHLAGWGSRPGAWNHICTAQSSGAGRALLCLERHLGRERVPCQLCQCHPGQ